MKNLKKLVSWFAVICIAVSMIPTVLADEELVSVGTLEGWTVTGGNIELTTARVRAQDKTVLKWTRNPGETTTLTYDVGYLEAGDHVIKANIKIPGAVGKATLGLTEYPNVELTETKFFEEFSGVITVDEDSQQSYTITIEGGDCTEFYISEVFFSKKAHEDFSDELLAIPSFDDIDDEYLGTCYEMLKILKGVGWGWTSMNREDPELTEADVNGKIKKVIKFYPLVAAEWGHAVIQGDFFGEYLPAGEYEATVTYKTIEDPGYLAWGLRNDVEGGMSTKAVARDHELVHTDEWRTETARFTVTEEGENGLAFYSDCQGNDKGTLVIADTSVKQIFSVPEPNIITNYKFVKEIEKEDTGIEVGEYLQMGTFYGAPILWRCVSMDANGPLMLADRILTTRAFDAAGSHPNDYRGLRENFGSNLWETSNLRAWLNSDAQQVAWPCGNAPVAENLWNGYNAYADDAGFLTNFTDGEKAFMKEVSQKQIVSYRDVSSKAQTGNAVHVSYSEYIEDSLYNYDSAYSYNLTDKVFVLDIKQAYDVYENSEILGEDYFIGKLSPQCALNSEHTFGAGIGQTWHTWLRTPYATSERAETVRILWSNGWVERNAPFLSYIGVRPAFYANVTSATTYAGEGTASNPYVLQ